LDQIAGDARFVESAASERATSPNASAIRVNTMTFRSLANWHFSPPVFRSMLPLLMATSAVYGAQKKKPN